MTSTPSTATPSEMATDMAIDFLTQSFQTSATLKDSWYNNTCCLLTVQGERVVAGQFIPAGTYLGEIMGVHRYAWDIPLPSPYIITVDDDYVIDGTEAPRSVLTMIRNAYYIGLNENCMLQVATNCDEGDDKIGMMTLVDIRPGEELLY
jgi:hypothetical protein